MQASNAVELALTMLILWMGGETWIRPKLRNARSSVRTGCHCTLHFGELRYLKTVPVTSSHVTSFHSIRSQSYRDSAPASVGVRPRVIAKSIEVRQIVSDRCKSLLFGFPRLREVSLSSRCCRHALEY